MTSVHKILFVCCLLALLFSCKKQRETGKENTQIVSDTVANDSVTISISDVNYTYTQERFRHIVDSFPQLSMRNDIIEHPDSAYFKYPVYTVEYTFGSEAGQDEFYLLYAHFLKDKYDYKSYEEERSNLIKLYRFINDFYRSINNGGTYFGHQYCRIVGYTEYDIYKLSRSQSPKIKSRYFVPEKNAWLNKLENVITKSMEAEREDIASDKSKKLRSILTDIDNLITSSFYLARAIDFERQHYVY